VCGLGFVVGCLVVWGVFVFCVFVGVFCCGCVGSCQIVVIDCVVFVGCGDALPSSTPSLPVSRPPQREDIIPPSRCWWGEGVGEGCECYAWGV